MRCSLSLALALAVAAVPGFIAHAGPLGPVWRARLARGKRVECPRLVDLPGAFAGSADGRVVTYDRATGALAPLAVPGLGAPGKSVSARAAVGDTLFVSYENTTIAAVDGKTGALRWRRDLDPATRRGLLEVQPFAGDVLLLAEDLTTGARTLERADAATGASRWKVTVPAKPKAIAWLVPAATRAFVIAEARFDHQDSGTIFAFDRDGKPLWSVDDKLDALFGWAVTGDDLLYIHDDRVHVYSGATGKRTDWEVYGNSKPVAFGDTVYVTPVDLTVEAFAAAAGRSRWKTQLPARGDGEYRAPIVVGAAGGSVYVLDDDMLRVLDAATGKLGSSFGVGRVASSHLRVRDGAPAVTYCTDKQLIALDPSAPADEHQVKIRGRIHCRNCDKTTQLDVRIGDQVMHLGRARRFAITVTARGSLPLMVRDATFPNSAAVKTIEFSSDRTIDLGVVSVKVPELAPGED